MEQGAKICLLRFPTASVVSDIDGLTCSKMEDCQIWCFALFALYKWARYEWDSQGDIYRNIANDTTLCGFLWKAYILGYHCYWAYCFSEITSCFGILAAFWCSMLGVPPTLSLIIRMIALERMHREREEWSRRARRFG